MQKLNRIKIVLAEKDKTNNWLAKRMNKDKSTISRWCTNDMQPSLETLFEIANVLQVSPKDLICELKTNGT